MNEITAIEEELETARMRLASVQPNDKVALGCAVGLVIALEEKLALKRRALARCPVWRERRASASP